MARYLSEFADGRLINIAGGCCGNTPEHIAAIAKVLDGRPSRKFGTQVTEASFASPGEIESRA
jgi:5-methyltetrahydrofolate--homocysteine methyltransferase